MARRLAPAVLSAMLLAVAPELARAQSAPDERAAAQAFADITLPAARELEATNRAFVFDAPRCNSTRRIARATVRQQMRVAMFLEIHGIASRTRVVEPILARTVAALDRVRTADPILRGGRASWHSVQRTYARIGSLLRVRICPVLRDYVRGDFKPTREMRRAARMRRFAFGWDTTRIDRAQARAIERMVQLGVPREQAEGFDGEI
jgi:hypothetical protein